VSIFASSSYLTARLVASEIASPGGALARAAPTPLGAPKLGIGTAALVKSDVPSNYAKNRF
jgi:hypothetical protein